MASTGQALAHSPQLMQRFLRTTTPPPSLRIRTRRAAAAQGAGSQARQTRASNPWKARPDDRIRMPAVSQESRLCTILAQARREWQPDAALHAGVVRISRQKSPLPCAIMISLTMTITDILCYLYTSFHVLDESNNLSQYPDATNLNVVYIMKLLLQLVATACAAFFAASGRRGIAPYGFQIVPSS